MVEISPVATIKLEKAYDIMKAIHIAAISDAYQNWWHSDGNYEDVKGFCCSVSIERFTKLKAEFEEQLTEETT